MARAEPMNHEAAERDPASPTGQSELDDRTHEVADRSDE